MHFLCKPLKAMDDPLWLWPSAVKCLILSVERQALTYHFATRDSSQNSSFVFSAAGFFRLCFFFLIFPLGIFILKFHYVSLLCQSNALQKHPGHRWIRFNRSRSRFPDSLLCQRQQPFGPRCVGLRAATTCSCHFRMTRGILGNYHAWA